MSPIPDNPDAKLTRDQTAAALTESGFPTAAKTLATKASRGGGPPFQKYGPRVLYRWGNALGWARARLSAPRGSTSEGDSPPAPLGKAVTRERAAAAHPSKALKADDAAA